MSNFFLINDALKSDSFENFKLGVQDLMQIKKKAHHTFYRNDSCYNNKYFVNNIFPHLENDRDIFQVYDFFARLSPCNPEIHEEESANDFCQSNQNGFLGISFNNINIDSHKKITNQNDYDNWDIHYKTKFETLEALLNKIKYTSKFAKAFNNASEEIQTEITDKFREALKRDFINYPDTKIISNVSVSNKCVVLELRVYQPMALRVYFNVVNGVFYLANIENKSNPNQNEDIRNAQKLLIFLKDQ